MPGAKTSPNACKRTLMVRDSLLAAGILVTVCILATVPLHAGMPQKQRHESRHEIDQLEDEWREAILKSNTAEMEKLLADDYLAITASGRLQTKEQALASLRLGHMHFTTLDVTDRKVRFYGTTALVTSQAEVKGATEDGDVSGSYRYTRVYVRDAQGSWKVVSFEVSKIREPGDRR